VRLELGGWEQFNVVIRKSLRDQPLIVLSHKIIEKPVEFRRAGRFPVRFLNKPVANNAHNFFRLILVSFYVRTREVGERGLKTESLRFHNQGSLLPPFPSFEGLTANIQSEFERHVQSKEVSLATCSTSREIMNSETGFFNQLDDLLNTRLARIRALDGESWLKSKC